MPRFGQQHAEICPTTCRDFLPYEYTRLHVISDGDMTLNPMLTLERKDMEEIQAANNRNIKRAKTAIIFDDDSGLGWDSHKESPFLLSCSDLAAAIIDLVTKPKSSILPPAEFPMRRKKSIISICSFNFQKAASGTKRPLQETYTPVFQKNNDSNAILDEKNANLDDSACSAGHESIIDAVDRLSDEPDLIADGSRPYCLPTIPGKHGDLKYISCHTMASLVRGNYSEEIGNINIIDCRYPYEYRGGHVKGAMNMYHREEIRDFLHRPGDQSAIKNNIIIFHCEFSSERGPKLYRFLRSEDRDLHKENYPQLHYPEVYLLDGGYKAFFESYKELCEPESYTPMIHNAHTADLRHFRVKSKSWEAEEKRQKSRQALRF